MTTKSPYPLNEGRALRSYNLIKQAAMRHDVHLASFVQTPEEQAGIAHMRTVCSDVRSVDLYLGNRLLATLLDVVLELGRAAPLSVVKYDTRAMRRVLKDMLATHQYDVIHIDMLHLGEYLDLFGDIPTVLMGHNVEAQILERRAQTEGRWWARLYLQYQARKLANYEASAYRRVTRGVAVSRDDAELLTRRCHRDDIDVLPNGVDTSFFEVPDVPNDPFSLIYVGGFTWFPNLDAIQHFVGNILPLIEARCPQVRLTVVGKCPDSPAVRALAERPNVRFAGLVDDIRPLVGRAAVYIVPLRIGGGTRLKILDALSMKRAIVSTSIGCEGIEVNDHVTIRIADAPQAFADAVIDLFDNPAAGARLGEAGRRLVQHLYEWAVLGDQLDAVYKIAAGRPTPEPCIAPAMQVRSPGESS